MKNVVTAATRTRIGPRDENQDRAFRVITDDGAWMIAVADGLGGHPRAAEAAQAAVDCLNSPVANEEEMVDLFRKANRAVGSLSDIQLTFSNAYMIPMTTLAVAVSDPSGDGQTLVGWTGDTMVFALSHKDGVLTAIGIGRPHGAGSRVDRCLGFPDADPEMASIQHADLAGVAVLSDGAWGKLIEPSNEPDDGRFRLQLDCAWEAGDVANLILRKAEERKLRDNSTAAVVCW